MGVLFSHENSDLSASKPTKRAHNAHCSNTLRAIASYFPLCLADPLGLLFSHENSDLSTSKYAMTTFRDCVKKFEVSGAHILFLQLQISQNSTVKQWALNLDREVLLLLWTMIVVGDPLVRGSYVLTA